MFVGKWLLKRILFLIPLLLLAACSRSPEGTVPKEVDPAQLTIYHNGTILTMEEHAPTAEAISIRGQIIERVGSNEDVLASDNGAAVLIDLEGRTLMPGFVDTHTHLLNDHRSLEMSLDEAQFQAFNNGITTLGTTYVDKSFLREIQEFEDAGFLRIRTGLYLIAADACGSKKGDWWKDYVPTDTPGEMLRINGVKIFTDGGSCGQVALSFELEPGRGNGDLWFSQDELNELIAEVHAEGYQAAVHAIGDRAVTQALNSLETALDSQPNTLRHRMEHVSVIPPEDVPRFGEIGIIPVLMGEFPNCSPYGPPVPEEYGHMEWPWRALRDANPGLSLAWHSDVPFQSINPFDHLLGFVTRIDTVGRAVCPPEEWLKEHLLTVEEALSIMTIQSAYALNREDEVGSLSPGKYADFIILDENPLQALPDELADNRVLLTVVGGRTEYCWASTNELCPGFTNRDPIPLPDTRPPLLIRWLAALLILLVPVGAVLMNRRHNTVVLKVGGLAGIVGGAAWLLILFISQEASDASFLLFILPFFFMALGVAGLSVLWGSGVFGILALWISLLGAIAAAEGVLISEWFKSDSGWALLFGGILAHIFGLFLFGLANLKRQVLPRLNAAPLVIGLFAGLVPFALSFVLPESSDIPFLMLLGVLGGGWVLLGGLLLRSQTHNEKTGIEE